MSILCRNIINAHFYGKYIETVVIVELVEISVIKPLNILKFEILTHTQ